MSATALQLEGTSRGARSQLLFRQLNEQIRSIAFDGDLDVVCECVNGTCIDRLVVPMHVYEAVRRFPTRFLVKEGHAANDVEREVDSYGSFVVVEKSGTDAEPAILLDPRRGARAAEDGRSQRSMQEARQ